MLVCVIALFCGLISVASTITDREQLLSSALTSVVQNCYMKQSNNIFVTSDKNDETHDSILQKTLAALDENISVTWILHDKDYSNGNIDRINNVIFTDSYQSFGLILKSITTTSIDHYGYYTVVLTSFFEDQETDLINIFRECWKHDIVNVNILTYSEATRPAVLLHTYFPFAPSQCGTILPVVWNTFEMGHFVEKNPLFPLKTKNLFQCPISILVSQFRPYVFVTRNNADATYDFAGIEYNLLLELAKRINFKLNFTVYWNPNLGALYDNGSASGAFGMVLKKEYNIIVGALVYGPLLKRILSSTLAYSYDTIILVVPNSNPYSAFEILFMPFTLPTWILISVTLGITVTVIAVLKRTKRQYYEFVLGTNKKSPYLNLLLILITGRAINEPRGNFARFVLMLWIMACFVLQTVYQGQLYNFMKINKMKPSVRNIDELIRKDISIKLIEENFISFLKFDKRLEKLLKFVDTNSKWEYVTENEAYIVFETQIADEMHSKQNERIFLTKPKTLKLTTCAHIMYLSKRFYLRETLDDHIAYMNENGLASKWNAPYKEPAILDYDDSNIPRKLNTAQILGLLEVWFGLLILASVVFISEIFSHHWMTIKKYI